MPECVRVGVSPLWLGYSYTVPPKPHRAVNFLPGKKLTLPSRLSENDCWAGESASRASCMASTQRWSLQGLLFLSSPLSRARVSCAQELVVYDTPRHATTCTSECWPDPASPSRPKVIKNTPHFASAIRPCPCARRGGRAVNAANGKPEELIGSRVLPYYNFGRFVGLFLVPC